MREFMSFEMLHFGNSLHKASQVTDNRYNSQNNANSEPNDAQHATIFASSMYHSVIADCLRAIVESVISQRDCHILGHLLSTSISSRLVTRYHVARFPPMPTFTAPKGNDQSIIVFVKQGGAPLGPRSAAQSCEKIAADPMN